MSTKSYVRNQIVQAADKIGGSKGSKKQRIKHCLGLLNWHFEKSQPILSFTHLTQDQLKSYLEAKAAQGCMTGTLHNILASVRVLLKVMSAKPNLAGISAKEIGLPPRSRLGTKEPITDEFFHQVLNRANALDERGFAITLELERYLGLRGLESMMSIPDLEQWAIEALNIDEAEEEVNISRGTKGGRKRVTQFIDAKRAITFSAILEALQYAEEHGGYLITTANGSLASAKARYHRLARQVGLVGVNAPHSLRYAYTTEKVLELVGKGYTKQEATRKVAMLLGHGPSRGRYVVQVYAKSIVNQLPKESKKARLKRSIEILKKAHAQSQNFQINLDEFRNDIQSFKNFKLSTQANKENEGGRK